MMISNNINIVTACSRPWNLKKLFKSINFKCKWYIVFDMDFWQFAALMEQEKYSFLKQDWIILKSSRGGVTGSKQKNAAIDLIDSGFVYFFDDDNLMHPYFYKTTMQILKRNKEVKGIFYSQFLNEKEIRNVFPAMIKENYIDQAQYLLHIDLLKGNYFSPVYNADGLLIMDIYRKNKEKELFYFYDKKAITYYNKLRY